MTSDCFTYGCLTTIAFAMLCAAARGGDGQYKAIWGKGLQSRYSVSKDDAGGQLMSPKLFDPYGDPRSEPGQIVANSAVKPYAVFKASAVNGKWVRVLIRQDNTTIKGWIDVAHLAGRDARWEEVVLVSQ